MNRRTRTIALAGLALGAACVDGTAPVRAPAAPVRVSAALAGSGVAFVSVEVTGDGISEPLVVTLPASGTVARGTLAVPAGAARAFTGRGYDAGGALTHAGAATVDVRPGTGASVALTLMPVQGGAGASSGTAIVTIAGGDVVLPPGATRALAATVAGGSGGAVTWATLDARVATVSRAGLVTAIAVGTTQVVAMADGGAALVTVNVQ